MGNYLTTAPRRRKAAVKVLGPVVEERFRLLEEEGKKGPNIPVSVLIFLGFDGSNLTICDAEQNDFLTHLLDLAPPDERNPTSITRRVLALNVAAIHTSALVCPPSLHLFFSLFPSLTRFLALSRV